MNKTFLQIIILIFGISGICFAQTVTKKEKRVFGTVLPNENLDESTDCWKEFRDAKENFQLQICGNLISELLPDKFKQKKIVRNSFLVTNKNATYIIGWFDWKLVNENEETQRILFDDFSNDTLKRGKNGSIEKSDDLDLNGKYGREIVFNVTDTEKMFMRTFYSNGKLFYLAFLPNRIYSNDENSTQYREKFFNSFKLLK